MKLQHYFAIGIFAALCIVGLIVFSYILIIGAVVGFVLFVINFIVNKIRGKKQSGSPFIDVQFKGSSRNQSGRVIDHEK